MSNLPTTWDIDRLSPAAELSNNDTRVAVAVAGAGTYANAVAAQLLSGNVYFSVAIRTDAAGAVVGAGIVDADFTIQNAASWVGSGNSGGIWGPNGSVYLSGAVIASAPFSANPQLIEFAVKSDSRRVWVRRNGQSWIGGGNPALDTAPTFTVPGVGGLFAAASLTKAGASSNRYVDLHASETNVTGSPPVGFSVGIKLAEQLVSYAGSVQGIPLPTWIAVLDGDFNFVKKFEVVGPGDFEIQLTEAEYTFVCKSTDPLKNSKVIDVR